MLLNADSNQAASAGIEKTVRKPVEHVWTLMLCCMLPPQGTSLALEMECCCTDVAVLLKAARARGAPLPKPVVQLLARQLLSAVAACHAVGKFRSQVFICRVSLGSGGPGLMHLLWMHKDLAGG